MWLSVGIGGVVGPYFWDLQGTNKKGVTARWYREMMVTRAIPAMQNFPNFASLVFQQDGAPPHFALAVRQLLDQTFPGRWMGRGSARQPAPIAWPPRLPDLTPLDFSVWGYLKQRIFTRDWRPSTLEELKAVIEEEVELVRQDEQMRRRIMGKYQRRLQICVDKGGLSVEIR